MKTCPSCQSENPDHAAFCLSCGAALEATTPAAGGEASVGEQAPAVGQPSAGDQPPAGRQPSAGDQPPGGDEPAAAGQPEGAAPSPPAQTPPAQPAGDQPATSVPPPAPWVTQQAAGAPGAPAGPGWGGAMSSAAKGRNTLFIGGAIGLVLVLALGIFLFRGEPAPAQPVADGPAGPNQPLPGPDDPAPQPPQPPQPPSPAPQPPSPAPQPDPQPQPQPDPQPQPVPPSGGLRDLVQQQIGAYTLAEAVDHAELLQAGAVEALNLAYNGPNGSLAVIQGLAAFPDQNGAIAVADTVGRGMVGSGWTAHEELPVTNDAGEVVGKYFLLSGQNAEGHGRVLVIFTNGRLYTDVFSAVNPSDPSQSDALLFFQALLGG